MTEEIEVFLLTLAKIEVTGGVFPDYRSHGDNEEDALCQLEDRFDELKHIYNESLSELKYLRTYKE